MAAPLLFALQELLESMRGSRKEKTGLVEIVLR
jgi:hypothetical protein